MEISIPELVSRLTLEEKARLCAGADFWHTVPVERLGIPSLMMSDGPHGLRTQRPGATDMNDSIQAVCFPAGCATAASFDVDLLRREGEIIGREARAVGVGLVLGPAVNIKRSPLCGRNFEYYSEDPFLAGELAAAYINGLQSNGVGASIKHYAANNQEYRRMTVSANMDGRTLREIYLSAFARAVRKSQPWSVMASYNRVNGVAVCESAALLDDILRGEMGFEGFVVSDWGAVGDRAAALSAGLDLSMPGPEADGGAALARRVAEGRVSAAALDKAVSRILNIVLRWADLDAATPRPALDLAADHRAAAEMAKECGVLLKNRGVLPLRPEQKVAYIGGFAQTPRYQGGGSSHINVVHADSALEAARANGRGVTYVEGFPADRDQREEAEFLRAVEAAEAADVAVVFAGLPESFESEGYDRKHMRLPECQDNLIARIAAVQKNTVVVLHTGSPVECPWADDVAGVLCMYLGGEGVGTATDALLYGDANPSGRLAESWPLRLEDNPSYLDFPGDGRNVDYREGVFVGYRWYDGRKMPVRWPFGHGLSYTGFVYSDPALSADTLTDGGEVTVSVTVRNSGAVAGKEVVQMYVGDETGASVRPPKELRGFVKVALAPGEEKRVSMTLRAEDLRTYEADGRTGFGRGPQGWYAASGSYTVMLGHSSRNIPITLPLTYLAGSPRPIEITPNTPVGDLMANPTTAPVVQKWIKPLAAMLAGNGGSEESGAITAETAYAMLDSMPLRALGAFGGKAGAELLDNLMDELSQATDASR